MEPATSGSPGIELDDLVCTYGSKLVLKNLTARVGSGECVALFGRNGVGKSTLIRTLLGLKPPTSGRSYVFGFDTWSEGAKARELIGFTPEIPVFPNRFTVRAVFDLLSDFFTQWDQGIANELSAMVKLSHSDRVGRLSKGNVVQLALIAAIARCPRILVLDEPFSSLDPVSRQSWQGVLRQVLSSKVETCLYSTHVVSDTEGLCNRVVIMSEGRFSHDFTVGFARPTYFRLQDATGRDEPPPVLGCSVVQRDVGKQIVVVDQASVDELQQWAEHNQIAIESVTIADLIAGRN